MHPELLQTGKYKDEVLDWDFFKRYGVVLWHPSLTDLVKSIKKMLEFEYQRDTKNVWKLVPWYLLLEEKAVVNQL